MTRFAKQPARPAQQGDAAAIARIWNHGIAERIATFETEPRSAADVERALADGRPAVVVEQAGEVVAWAWASPYSSRACYAGIGELSVYVDPARRRGGFASAALTALFAECESRSHWKLIAKVFAENVPSLALLARHGFREIGKHVRHARLDGRWRDVIVVEKLLGDAAR